MIADQKLTPNFTLYELTRTDRLDFVEKNREVTEDQIKKLAEMARLLEHIRFILDCPIIVHSAYRCPELNDAIGSSEKSQHLRCEATDFTPGQQDLGFAHTCITRLC